MTAQQSIARRRRAMQDPRYQGYRRDATKRALRMQVQVKAEQLRKMRAKAKK